MSSLSFRLQWTCWIWVLPRAPSSSTNSPTTITSFPSPTSSTAWRPSTTGWNRSTKTWSTSPSALTCVSTGCSMFTTRACTVSALKSEIMDQPTCLLEICHTFSFCWIYQSWLENIAAAFWINWHLNKHRSGQAWQMLTYICLCRVMCVTCVNMENAVRLALHKHPVATHNKMNALLLPASKHIMIFCRCPSVLLQIWN